MKSQLMNEAAAAARPTRKEPLFPFLDLRAQYAGIRHEVITAVESVLNSQHFILGPEVEKLEAEIARYIGCKHAIACASGSDALLLALMALDIDTGDEVITTPFTFGATAGSIVRLKAKPVFVDIDPVTYNMDPKRIEAAITPRTRAIMPVHLFGLPAEMAPIMDIAAHYKLPVIEDAAQAIGSRYRGEMIGSIGTIGCFSFFPSKNLGSAGDGGIMTTNDDAIAAKLRMLRLHGCRKKYQYEIVGMNSRLDALQAAIVRVKLPHLDDWAAARRTNAARYTAMFRDASLDGVVTTPVEPVESFHVYNQYVIRVPNRDRLREYLQSVGIPTEIYYPYPLHTEKAYDYLGHNKGDFPQAESASREVLALPVYPELTQEQQSLVVEGIASFFQQPS